MIEKDKYGGHVREKDCSTWSDYYYAGFFGCNCHMYEKYLRSKNAKEN